MWKRCKLFISKCIVLFPILLAIISPSQPVSASPAQVKELNFVFLHGMSGTSAATQLLADTIEERAQAYISNYEQANPGITIRINTLQRNYPNDVNIDTWAKNIAEAIGKHFAGKRDLILVGHSMGGKAALYAVAHNTGNLSDSVSMVVTINSPIRALNSYYAVGGGSVSDYIRGTRLTTDKGIADSIGVYDSSADGQQVATSKHWLAFISAESAPLSTQFDFLGVDPAPKDMDDGLVPISAQYSKGADVVYYGEQGHSAVSANTNVAGTMADQILHYLFGGTIETAVSASDETFEHHAGWLPLTYHWNDKLGELPGTNGIISHTNNSFFKWQEWEDVVGGCSAGSLPSSYQVRLNSFPFLTKLGEARWLNSDNKTDCRLYIKTRAGPKGQVKVQWNIIQYQLLSQGVNRGHYEIKVTGGTSLVQIPQASWLATDTADTRVQVQSQAEGPFHWFKARVELFYQQSTYREVIDEIPSHALSVDNQ